MPKDSPPPFRSIARRQAILTAGAAFIASTLVGGTLLNIVSDEIRARIEDRLVALADEREKQVEALVRARYQAAAQIASRSRLRELTAELATFGGGGPDERAEAAAILREAAAAGEGVVGVSLVTRDGRTLARVGAFARPSAMPVEGFRRPLMTPPRQEGGEVLAEVAAPVEPPDGGAAAAAVLMTVDSGDLQRALANASLLGPGGTMAILPSDHPLLRRVAGGPPAKTGVTTFEGQLGERLAYWRPIRFNPGEADRWRFLVSIPTAEAYEPLRRLRWWLVGVAGVVAVVVTAASYLVARRMGRRLRRLTELAERAAAGELDGLSETDPLVADEIGALAGAFSAMGQRVGGDLRAARDEAEAERAKRARLTAELEVAREVQSRLYPAGPLAAAGASVAGRSEPAEQLCGDYFDYFESPAGLVFAVGDVSGHGVGPSLLMVEVRSVLRTLRRRPEPLVDVVRRLNDRLAEESPSDRFVSLLVGRFHAETGEVEYVGSGHRGLIVRRGGAVETLPSTGLLLGLFAGAEQAEGRARLGPGDLLVVASDGIEETAGPGGRPFGWRRVGEAAAEAAGREPAEIVEVILASSHEYGGRVAAADDRTLLVLRRDGRPA